MLCYLRIQTVTALVEFLCKYEFEPKLVLLALPQLLCYTHPVVSHYVVTHVALHL